MFSALDCLNDLATNSREWLLSQLHERQVIADELIVSEGQPSPDLYIVFSGLLSVFVTGNSGERREIATMGAGELFGDIAWLEQSYPSASVRALESSVIGRVDGTILTAKVNADPVFGLQFYRALGLQSAVRVRRLTAFAAQQVSELQTETEREPLFEQIDRLKSAIAWADREAIDNKGSLPSERFLELQTTFDRTVELIQTTLSRPEQALSDSRKMQMAAVLQRELLPYILLTETAERFYSKPRGYAGDAQTIRQVYLNKPAGTGRIGPLIDACFLDRPPSKAVRNRRGLLAKEICAEVARCGTALVTSLACGPAAEAFDAFNALTEKEVLTFTGIDIDVQALDALRLQADETGLERQVAALRGNLVHLATGRQQFDQPPQDLVYSIGLIDYFNDEFVIHLLNWVHDRLAPGGRIILGNFHPRNPDREFMDRVLDWKLIHRTEDDMRRLFAESKFARPCSRIMFEAEQINLFAEGSRAA
jgi:extracellular factor (EF) 3-hydroxypalmitic acid methyl ester biosynthesis protein